MDAFQYESAASVDEAIKLLAREGAAPLAGGTDLLVQLHQGTRSAALIVDVKSIPDLRQIELNADGLTLGAAVSCWELSEHTGVREQFPGLMEAAELIGSMQIQGRASVGGNLCNGSPAADTTPALIALDAVAIIAGPDGTREVAVESFVTGPGETALGPRDILVSLRVPTPAPRTADAYLRFIPRAEMDIAVAGAGVSVSLDEGGICTAARVALGAVAPTPLLVNEAADVLVGSRLDDDALREAGRRASEAARPISDKRGPAEYRRRLAGVLTRRAAAIAAERARSRS
jgi:carbon-monoxide dehydrogenase medium subunit